MTTFHELKRSADGVLLATQEAITVQFHLEERRAVEVHPAVRARIETMLDDRAD